MKMKRKQEWLFIKNMKEKLNNKLNKKLERLIRVCTIILKKNLRGTNKGVILLSALVTGVVAGLSSMEIGIPEPIAFIIVTVVVFFLYLLAAKLVIWLLKIAFKIQPEYIFAVVLPFIGIISFFFTMAYKATDTACALLGILFAVIGILFARSFYAVFFKRVRSVLNMSLLIITACGCISMVIFLTGGGFHDSYISEYIQLVSDAEDGTAKEALASSAMETVHLEVTGESLQIDSVSYGSKGDLESKSINLSTFVGYEGFTEKIRDFYWGFGIDEVPLVGQIWYPVDGGSYPVLFIIHGNHIMTAESHLGYAYLGEYLAGQGYVVVSVDENFLNGYLDFGLNNENDARAVLLLENIGQILQYNEDASTVLYQKIDESNIAVAGHSRGGEAVAIAALFNNYDRYPDNGGHTLDYHYSIKSVIAIAPTCDQYKPAGSTVALQDVNYLLIHGSNDQDVNSTMGLKQYENVTFGENTDYFKSFLYIAGANHGQFNTIWGRCDRSLPESLLLNTNSLITEADQQDILKTSLKLFLDATLLGEKEKKEFFMNCKTTDVVLPDTVYVQSYSDSTFEAVCDFEEDTDITTGTKEGVSLFAASMSYWGETRLSASSESYAFGYDNSAVQLRWSSPIASYLIDLSSPYSAAGMNYFQLDAMNVDEETVKNKEYSLLSFTIELTDSDGRKAMVSTASYADVFPPFPVLLSKLEYLSKSYHFKENLQTIRIPLKDFEGDNNFDINKITRICLLFDQTDTGNIKADNIGFSK